MPSDDWFMEWPIVMLSIEDEVEAMRGEVFVFSPDGSSFFGQLAVFDYSEISFGSHVDVV